jgi:hypothetical protein
METTDDPLLSRTEAADYLTVSTGTLRRYELAGIIEPGLRIGPRRKCWRKSALDNFASKKEGATG